MAQRDKFYGDVVVLGSISGSSITGSLLGTAATASYVNPLIQNVTVTGSINTSGSVSIIQRASFNGISSDGTLSAAFTPIDNLSNTTLYSDANLYLKSNQYTFFNSGFATSMLLTNAGNLAVGPSFPLARVHIKGSGTTSATTAFLVQDASGNNSIQTTDDNVTRIGRTSTYANATTALIVGHKTSNQYGTQLVLDPNKDDNTYYKLVLESNYSGANPFTLYSSGNQTWLYGYGNPMFAQGPGMKIPNQISMGTTDIGKSEISGSVLFIHGADYYARQAYIRMTSYTTGVDTLRGGVVGLWTDDKLRLWNYENTSVDIGVNNTQRLQVTPSGINVTGSIVTTNNITASIVSATNNGIGTNFKVGDDTWIGDINVANTMQVMGQQNADRGYIRFGSGSSNPVLGANNSNTLDLTGNLTTTGTINSVTLDNNSWASYGVMWSSDAVPPSLGNGTLEGYYKQIGKTVFIRVKLVFGTTTNGGSGNWYFSLPTNAAAAYGVQFPCSILNDGLAWYQGTVNGQYGGFIDKTAVIVQSAGGANSSQGLTATHPFTFGNLDSVQFNGSYEAL